MAPARRTAVPRCCAGSAHHAGRTTRRKRRQPYRPDAWQLTPIGACQARIQLRWIALSIAHRVASRQVASLTPLLLITCGGASGWVRSAGSSAHDGLPAPSAFRPALAFFAHARMSAPLQLLLAKAFVRSGLFLLPLLALGQVDLFLPFALFLLTARLFPPAAGPASGIRPARWCRLAVAAGALAGGVSACFGCSTGFGCGGAGGAGRDWCADAMPTPARRLARASITLTADRGRRPRRRPHHADVEQAEQAGDAARQPARARHVAPAASLPSAASSRHGWLPSVSAKRRSAASSGRGWLIRPALPTPAVPVKATITS